MIHSPFNFKHKIVGTMAVPQLNAELWERNFLCCLVNIEVHDLSRGPTIRTWPNSGSNEFFNDVTTSKDSTRKVKCILTAPDPDCPMIVVRSALCIQRLHRRGERMGRSFVVRNRGHVNFDVEPI
jgi:hypothetical protein